MSAPGLSLWSYAEPTSSEMVALRRGRRIEGRCLGPGRVWAILCGDERVYYVPGREQVARRTIDALNGRDYDIERLRHLGRLQRGEA